MIFKVNLLWVKNKNVEYEGNCNIIGIFWELFYTFVYSIYIYIDFDRLVLGI